jgi:hypothetical protein
MTELDFKNIEFYKEQYNFEHERGKYYDSLIQFPTTLLAIFIGAILFLVEKHFGGSTDNLAVDSTLNLGFIIILTILGISILLTIFYLAKVFYGLARKYEYLPFTSDLKKHELQLYKYNYKYSTKTNYQEKREEAKALTCQMFYENLKNYYVDLTEKNQKINDKRAGYYFYTRTFISIDLILLIYIAIVTYLN